MTYYLTLFAILVFGMNVGLNLGFLFEEARDNKPWKRYGVQVALYFLAGILMILIAHRGYVTNAERAANNAQTQPTPSSTGESNAVAD